MHSPASTLLRAGHRALGLLIHLGLLGLLGWLAGCGAGLGGTGTGDRAPDLSTFGATATSVCSGTLGTVLGCASGSDTLPGAQPVAVVFFSDSTGTRRARLEGDSIELQLPCSGLQFIGSWGTVSGQTPRFYGRLMQGGGESLATLTADVLADGSLELRLFSSDGRLLAGPLKLSRSGPPGGVVLCP